MLLGLFEFFNFRQSLDLRYIPEIVRAEIGMCSSICYQTSIEQICIDPFLNLDGVYAILFLYMTFFVL